MHSQKSRALPARVLMQASSCHHWTRQFSLQPNKRALWSKPIDSRTFWAGEHKWFQKWTVDDQVNGHRLQRCRIPTSLSLYRSSFFFLRSLFSIFSLFQFVEGKPNHNFCFRWRISRTEPFTESCCCRCVTECNLMKYRSVTTRPLHSEIRTQITFLRKAWKALKIWILTWFW